MKITNKTTGNYVEFNVVAITEGSEKQIDWADSIRASIYNQFGGFLMDNNADINKVKEAYKSQLDKINNNATAKFWIDNRSKTMQMLIKEAC